MNFYFIFPWKVCLVNIDDGMVDAVAHAEVLLPYVDEMRESLVKHLKTHGVSHTPARDKERSVKQGSFMSVPTSLSIILEDDKLFSRDMQVGSQEACSATDTVATGFKPRIVNCTAMPRRKL